MPNFHTVKLEVAEKFKSEFSLLPSKIKKEVPRVLNIIPNDCFEIWIDVPPAHISKLVRFLLKYSSTPFVKIGVMGLSND